MLPAATFGIGMNFGFPDICVTPIAFPPGPMPLPYPNIGLFAMAQMFSVSVKLCMMPGLNIGSMIPMTTGDEPGCLSPIMGPGMFTMGSPNVFIDCLPAITLACPATGNNMNAPGIVSMVGQFSVNFSYAGGAGERAVEASLDGPVSAGEIAALREALDGGAPVARGALLDDVGYVHIAVFGMDLPRQAYNEIRRLEGLGARALVLDLRGNPGGSTESFTALAGELLREGDALVTIIDEEGDATTLRAPSDGAFTMPLVVLVDRGTASAAELFAGCLKAHGRARVVGETTYGKGTAQRIVPGESGIARATVARHVLPNGDALDGVGVTPDVEIAGSVASGVDPARPDLTRDAALKVAWEIASREA